MFELQVKVDFCAAHHLQGYPGDCARPHGHNWVLQVFARSEGLDSLGMALDFRTLKSAARDLIGAWDHQDLNTLEDFRGINPSAEQIAKLAYERLSERIGRRPAGGASERSSGTSERPAGGTWIDRVTVWENDRCSASYFESSGSR